MTLLPAPGPAPSSIPTRRLVLLASRDDEVRRMLASALRLEALVEVLEVAEPDALQAAVAQDGRASGADGPSLVLVDDADPDFRRAAAQLWRQSPGVLVEECGSVAIAIEIARRERSPRAVAARRAAVTAVVNEARCRLAELPQS